MRLALGSALGQLDIVLLGDEIKVAALNLKSDFATPTALAFLPHSTRLAIASSNSQVMIFDLRNDILSMSDQDNVVYRGHRGPVVHLAAEPNGNFLYSASEDGQVLRWDLSITDQRTQDFRGQVGEWFTHFHCLSYSPDGRWLAAGGTGYETVTRKPLGDLLLIDVATRTKRSLEISQDDPVFACVFSSDSQRLLYGCGPEKVKTDSLEEQENDGPYRYRVWNVAQDQAEPDDDELAAAFGVCHAGERLLVANSAGKLAAKSWPANTARDWTAAKESPSPIRALLASASGTVVVGLLDDRTLSCWDAATGRELWLSPQCGKPPAIAVSHRGDLVATTLLGNAISGGERQAVLYEVGRNSPRLVIGGHSTLIQALAISADGTRLVSGDREGILKIWDAAPQAAGDRKVEARELLTIENAHRGGVQGIAFHPDGRELASIGKKDALLRIWWTE
jgi:WD40 repeat protein